MDASTLQRNLGGYPVQDPILRIDVTYIQDEFSLLREELKQVLSQTIPTLIVDSLLTWELYCPPLLSRTFPISGLFILLFPIPFQTALAFPRSVKPESINLTADSSFQAEPDKIRMKEQGEVLYLRKDQSTVTGNVITTPIHGVKMCFKTTWLWSEEYTLDKNIPMGEIQCNTVE
ncbi:hypothetical protein STEG23_011478 [Scotinomys teguina]